ncbi:hypothetical protein HY468_04390 [Candidatus Roizmanbacteria bacterium]|nr:hypothetical protein [Candidatus Roizmanbacteria bacterium]
MRYPWVCLSICGILLATVVMSSFEIVDATTIYIYATITVLILFLLGFARS